MEEEEDKEIQEKQILLQGEIIDKNYDKTTFINFCLSKKENGDDLNNWTLEELKQIIDEFTSQHKPPETANPPQQGENQPQTQPKPTGENKPKSHNPLEEEDDEIKKENLEKMEKYNVDELKNMTEKLIECRKLEKTELNDKPISITVNNPKEMGGGVFGKNYILYEVHVDPFGWKVMRRYSDFDWLRKLLIKYYPSHNVPPLPNKKIGNRNYDADFIMKRMKFLNLFINNVVQSEPFKASQILMAFLSYEDRGKFDAKFKEFSTQVPSAYVEDYKTLDGKVIVVHDEGHEKYFTNISKYFRLQTQLLIKLNQSLKDFYLNMSAACINLQDVKKNFEVLHILNTRVLMKQTITNSFSELSVFFDNWKKVLIKQKEMVKNHMKDFYKYVNFEGRSYKELIDRREELRAKYVAESAKLTQKKEKLFATGDISKFELGDDKGIDRDKLVKDKVYAFSVMCKKDTLELEKLYNQLGFANKMNISELKKMIKEYCVRYVENIKAFDQEFYPTINDLVGSWTNMETFVMSATMANSQ